MSGDKLFTSRLEQVCGPIPDHSVIHVDSNQWIVKPNLYSKTGNLITSNSFSACSYGSVACMPVSITYGLDSEQCEDVLNKCLSVCDEIDNALIDGSDEEVSDLCKMVMENACAVLSSNKSKEDETITSIVRKLNKSCQEKYYKIMDCISNIKTFNKNVYLQNYCHKMYMTKGSFAKEHLERNKEELLEDMRSEFIPFMGNSTLEQDHWGINKIDDNSLTLDDDEWEVKSSTISFSPIHAGGVHSVASRLGLDLPMERKNTDPMRKKKVFMKANQVFDALSKVDDPRLERSFSKLWSRFGSDSDKKVNWDKVVAFAPDLNPIIVPVIVESSTEEFPTDYNPMKALDVLDALTNLTDWNDGVGSLSINQEFDQSEIFGDDSEKFPFGGAAPFSPPRRVNPEIK